MRHGETDWNKKKLVQGRKDIPLNEYGRHLARETSYGMRQYQIDLAYTSPLRRAKETAEILLEGRNIPLYEDQRIQEISFGSYEGMSCVDKTKEENLAFQKFFQDTGNYIPPGDAESVEQFWKNEVPPNCSVTIAELEGSGFKIIREGIIFYKEEVKHWKAV